MKVLISVLLSDFICLFMHVYFSKRKLRNNHASYRFKFEYEKSLTIA